MTKHSLNYPVLLIEDDDDLREAIGVTLRMSSIEFYSHQKAETVIPILQPGVPMIIVTDYKLPGMTGIDLLKKALEINPDLSIIVMTAFADVKIAVEALKSGARDFLIKPFVPEQLVDTIRRYQPTPVAGNPSTDSVSKKSAPKATNGVNESQTTKPLGKSIVAVDPEMVKTLGRCLRVAPTTTSVLITGESGVGK
jgi:DNA-binding NtrC family response regulator